MFGRNIGRSRTLAALQRAQIGDDRPPIGDHDGWTVSHHRVLAVGDGVENFAVSHFADPVVLQTNDRGQTVLFGDAVAGSGRAVAHQRR